MATTSQVKTGLDTVSATVVAARRKAAAVKLALTQVKQELTALPTTHADLIATINGYTPTGYFEEGAKDEFAKLTTEFQALKTAVTTAETSLAGLTEF